MGTIEEEGDGEDEENMAQVTEVLATKPNQPESILTVKQSVGKHVLTFQTQWYKGFSWLHFSPGVEGVLCFYCCKAFHKDTSPLAKNAKPAFISAGFKNWRKATERFSKHEKSVCHKMVITAYLYEDRSVYCQLASVSALKQEEARACLLKIIGAVQLLARQSLALRGHDSSGGNLDQLLKCKAEETHAFPGGWQVKRMFTQQEPFKMSSLT